MALLGWLGRRRADRLSESFARRLGGSAPALLPGSLIGLEHEYIVRRHSDGRRVNFAQLVHRIGQSQRGLDPTDANAYWLPSGAVVTADETEAELAQAPLATRPGFVNELVRRAEAGCDWLAERLAPDFYLAEGVSTHLSIAAPDELLERVCEAYTRSWAPALMLLLDDTSSPGLLVRPRPGRVELCGEFVAGDDLRAAALFALGSVLACLDDEKAGSGSPLPRLRLSLRLGDQRFGWYVDRRAGGSDLYAEGRKARLATIDGRPETAQEHLEIAWSAARLQLAHHARQAELDLVDRLVDGRSPLRVERPLPERPGRPLQVTGDRPSIAAPATAYGRAITARGRPGYELAPVMLTWQLAVFVIASDGQRRAFAAVPGRVLGRFLKLLDRGLLDEAIRAYLDQPSAGRRLPARPLVERAGLYDALYMRPALLPPERPLVSPGATA